MKRILLFLFMFFFYNTTFATFSIDEALESFKKNGTYDYKYSIISNDFQKTSESIEEVATSIGYKMTDIDYKNLEKIEERLNNILQNDTNGKIRDKLNIQLNKMLDSKKLSDQSFIYIYGILQILIVKEEKNLFIKEIEKIDKKEAEIIASPYYQISCIGSSPETQKILEERNGCENYKKDIMRGYIYEGMSGSAFWFLNYKYLENKYILEIDDSYLGEYYCQESSWKSECLWVSDGKVTNITAFYW